MSVLVVVQPSHAQTIGTPALSAPANGAANQPVTVSLQWSETSGASSYHAQVSTDPAFTAIVLDRSNLSATSVDAGPLANITTYYWRVRGQFLGFSGSWSAVWSFSTVPPVPASPVPVLPPNNSADQPLDLTLQWKPSPYTATQRLQIGTDSGFASPVLDLNIDTSSSTEAHGLQRSKRYFWRIQAANSGGTGPWSAAWNFTTIPVVPPVPVLAEPLNASFNQPVEITFQWNPSAGAVAYRLQVSNDSAFLSGVIDRTVEGTTSYRMQSLSNGSRYYWRVYAVNAGGTSAWSPMRHFTTVPAVPVPPSLNFPVNGTADQPTTLGLKWNSSANAATYRMQVSARSDFSQLLVNDSTITDTTGMIASLNYDSTYYWRVSAANAGGISAWSSVWSFKTVPPRPASPGLTDPKNGETTDSTTVTFSWNAPAKAVSYWLQISRDSLFSETAVNDSTVSGTSRTVSGFQTNAKYFWRVAAQNAGGRSPWSSVRSFIIRSSDTYAGPILLSPANGTIDLPLTLTLQWSDLVGAFSYQLQLSADANFAVTIYDNDAITNESQQVGPLENGKKYYWRVRGRYLLFNGDWSQTSNFTVMPKAPNAPELSLPLNGAAGLPPTVTLLWRHIPSAASYHVQVSKLPGFGTIVLDRTGLTDTTDRIGPLGEDSTFFWRVSGVNGGGNGSWSPVWYFTTASLPVPVPAGPPNGATVDSTSTTLSWSKFTGATSYWLQVSSDSTFASSAFSDSTVRDTAYKVSGLKSVTKYFWRVRTITGGNSSAWTSPKNFSTRSSASAAGPGLISPANNATDQSLTPMLSWASDPGASSYQLQAATEPNFTNVVYNDASLSATSQQIGPLQYGTAYYWRVKANYFLVSSDWSSVWKFTTQPSLPPAPILIAPAHGAVQQSITPQVSWSPVTGASAYHLMVSRDSTFGRRDFNDSAVTAANKTVGPLSIDTVYYWRVRARNSGGWGPYSGIRAFGTVKGALPSASTDAATNVTSVSATINASINPNGYATTARFQYGTTASYGNSVDAIPLTVNGDTVRRVSNTLHGLAPNTTYHYRISATNQIGSTEGTDRTFTTAFPAYPSSITVNANVYFPALDEPDDYTASDYRIVGLPGAGNTKVDSLLPGTQHRDWEVFWDDGSGADALTPFQNGGTFTFGMGRAYWLIKKGPWTVSYSVRSAPLDSSWEARIPLHAGWNLITNPFTSKIAWAKIRALDSTIGNEPIFSFNGNFSMSADFEPYAGYYFFNAAGKQYLRVPYAATFSPEPVISADALPKRSAGDWKVGISMTTEGSTDSSAWLGISSRGPEHTSRSRFHKPTGFQTIPSVYFDRPEWDPEHSSFAEDLRSDAGPLNCWTFTAWCPERTGAVLRFAGIEDIPPSYQVTLIDIIGARSVDLRKRSSYAIAPGNKRSEFLLAVGTADSIRKLIGRSITTPKEFSLGSNYPNPFNPETVIPVEVPYPSVIVLTVCNLLGQEITTLHSGRIDAGSHRFLWNGKDRSGSPVTTGVYFGRLTTEHGISRTTKMSLIR